jgi:polysaccharide export outer membrane protein
LGWLDRENKYMTAFKEKVVGFKSTEFGLIPDQKNLGLVNSNLLFTGVMCVFISFVLLVPCIVSAANEKFTGASSNPDEYRIGPEDVLEISVWKEEELQREVLVRPDGGISFPLAGDVQVEGKTPLEVEQDITTRVQKYIPEAVVTVSVKTVSGYTIFVNGKVKSPGKFVVGRYMDVMQAITLAGGLDTFADEDKIKVIRRQNGKQVVHQFAYNEVKKGKNLDQNIILQSGDVIVVP